MAARAPETGKGPIAWMAGNSVASNLLMFLLVVGGVLMASQIKKEVFPEFQMDIVNITVSYPGASPEEVENGIVLAVEEALDGLEGISEIDSVAKEGSATIMVEALEDADVTRLWQEISSEVDRITTLPDEAEEPQVMIESRTRKTMSLALYGDASELALREAAEYVRDMLLQEKDISMVELDGIRDYEIVIEIPQENLRRYGLTQADVATVVSRANVELGGGSLKTSGGEILMRMSDRRNYASEFATIPVLTGEDGSQILLEDIANVYDGFEESDSWAEYNGHKAVMFSVYRVGDQTPGQVADATARVIERMNEEFAGKLTIAVREDRADLFAQRADLLTRNAYMGLVIVFICLALFLEIRLAFWVSMGIPISFLGSFLILPSMGMSINMVTMFAFIITLGIVVDDAVVVGENVYHKRQAGMPLLKAAIEGAREIAMPVVFSVLTNIVAFMPLYFVPGFMGKIFGCIPLVVISVFAISLVESLFVLPAHLAHSSSGRMWGPLGWLGDKQKQFSNAFERFVRERYGRFLAFTLRNRYCVVAVGFALLIMVGGYLASGRMGMVLFPKVESDYSVAQATLPYGSSLERINAVKDRLVTSAQGIIDENGGDTLAIGIYTRVNSNVVQVRAYLTKPEVRPLSTSDFTTMWRKKVGNIIGLESIYFQADSGGPGGGKGLTVQLSHRSIEQLNAAGEELAEALSMYPSVADINDGSARGKKQYDFKLLPAGERIGLTSRDVANQVRNAYQGATALSQQRGRNEVTVRVRLPREERELESSLENFVLRTSDGREILLQDAATMTVGRAYTSIERLDGRRGIGVTANVTPQSKTNEIIAGIQQDVLPALVEKYPGLSYEFRGKQADQRESTESLITGLLSAILAIYMLLAIPFRSYTQPFIIMICIPFGIIGAVLGLLLMGYSMSIMALFGVVALSGVVVNDSLVLITFANSRRDAGSTLYDAIHDAGITRFRPIMLTTLTTFGGLGPMIFETSRQAKFLIPMAISLGFGIVFATCITLVLVPSLYLILEDVLAFFGKGNKQEEEDEGQQEVIESPAAS